MGSENVVHIKLNYEEAIQGKRNFLFSEMGALKVAKRIGRYKFLRLGEFDLRSKLYTKMKEVRSNIRRLQIIAPEPKLPKIIKRDLARREKEAEEPLKVKSKTYQQQDIESQLREIESRLEDLQIENT
jgi:hypothetical protein